MAEKKVVNKVDGFYILAHRQTKSLEELAKELKIKKEIIRAYLDENTDTSTTQPITNPSVVGTKAYDMMIKNRERGVTIMTPAASQVGDEVKVAQKQVVDNSSHVHKIRQ